MCNDHFERKLIFMIELQSVLTYIFRIMLVFWYRACPEGFCAKTPEKGVEGVVAQWCNPLTLQPE